MKFLDKIKPIRYNVNVCDHSGSEIMVHFTKVCDNKCAFCVDKLNEGVEQKRPDVDAIFETTKQYLNKVPMVQISGGEPMLFMDELEDYIDRIKQYLPSMVIWVNSAIPKVCFDKKEQFMRIYNKIDCLSMSAQHYDECIADKIRNSTSKYDRQKFYSELPNKEKVRLCINCVKPWLYKKEDIIECVKHYNDMGFTNIRCCEMFDYDNGFVDIPKTLGIKLKHPFAYGCSQQYDIKKLIPTYNGTFSVKQVCFLRTECKNASIWDAIKMITRPLFFKKYFFGVIHEDGTIAPYWV